MNRKLRISVGALALLAYVCLGCWAITAAGDLFNESDSLAVLAAMLLIAVTVLSLLFVPSYIGRWFFRDRPAKKVKRKRKNK